MFGKKNKPALIFVVEDNAIYAKTLQLFLKEKFPAATVEVFPVGELCIENMHRNPDVVITDYFLNDKYYDASDGLQIVKEIRAKNMETRIILLSAQQSINIAVEATQDLKASYVVKNAEAFKKVEDIIRSIG